MDQHLRLGCIGLAALCASCGGMGAPGNAALGIAELEIRESAERSTIVGFDANRRPVAILDLIHGRFVPTGDFGPAYNGREIDGRKLMVEIEGQAFSWETLGYTNTLHMPALPPELSAVAAFVAGEQVRPILDKWQIGWRGTLAQPRIGSQSSALVADETCEFTHTGTNPRICNACGGKTECPIRAQAPATPTTPACNGNPEYEGLVISQDAATHGWEQDVVAMCCGNGITGSYAVKTCAPAPGLNGCGPGEYCSACGKSGNKCQPCVTLLTPYSSGCSLYTQATSQSGVVRSCRRLAGIAPTITVLGADPLTLECGGAYVDPGARATDHCGADLTSAIATTGAVDATVVGAYSVTYSVIGINRVPASASRAVVVADTTAPLVTAKSVPEIWPPNHGWRAFTLADCAAAEDPCAGALDVNAAGEIVSISSDEPGADDIAITGSSSFELRAERAGEGNGRVYAITFTVSDPAGNRTTATCRIGVPHDQSGPGAVDDGASAGSTLRP